MRNVFLRGPGLPLDRMRESVPEIQLPPLALLEFIPLDHTRLDSRSRARKFLKFSQMQGYRLFSVNAFVYFGKDFDRLFVVVTGIVNDEGLDEFRSS